MTGAVYFLKLSQVGKSTHDKGTAAAHFRYVARTTAVAWELNEHLPTDYVETIKYIHRRERHIRKNGQVFSKIILNLPYALGQEQHKALVLDFCRCAGMGRVPFRVYAHSDTGKPHAHIIFFDADIDTGKRVFRMTDSGALFRLRALWETVVNKHLEMAEAHERISRWGKDSQHHKQLNEQARQKKYEKRYAAHTALRSVQLPHAPTGHQQPLELRGGPVEIEMAPKQMEVTMESSAILQSEDTDDFRRITGLYLMANRYLHELLMDKEKILQFRASYQLTVKSLQDTKKALEVAQHDLLACKANSRKADDEAASYNSLPGRLKALLFKGVRQRAKAMRMHQKVASYNLQSTYAKNASLLKRAEELETNKARLEREAEVIKAKMQVIGTDKDLEMAEQTLRDNVLHYTVQLQSRIGQDRLDQALRDGRLNPDEHMALSTAIATMGREQAQSSGYLH